MEVRQAPPAPATAPSSFIMRCRCASSPRSRCTSAALRSAAAVAAAASAATPLGCAAVVAACREGCEG